MQIYFIFFLEGHYFLDIQYHFFGTGPDKDMEWIRIPSCSSPGVVETRSRGRPVATDRVRAVAAPFGRPRVILAAAAAAAAAPAPAPVGTPAGRTFTVRATRSGIIGTSAGPHHGDGLGTVGAGLGRGLTVGARYSSFLGLTI